MTAATALKLSLAQLPGRAEAEERLQEAARSGAPPCAVAVAVDQYAQIASHFGPAAADQALEHVAVRVPAARLYRWTGGSLLILLETEASAGLLLSRLPDCYTVRLGADGHAAEVAFSVRARAFPAEPAPAMARRIDRWIAAPWFD
jgi:GGDEF domain-containing protein